MASSTQPWAPVHRRKRTQECFCTLLMLSDMLPEDCTTNSLYRRGGPFSCCCFKATLRAPVGSTGQYFKYISAHEIAGSIGPERATALPLFYAYMGCDIVSSVATRRKKLAWPTWNAFDDVTLTFCTLGDAPRDIDDEAMAILERITVLYDRTSDMDNIDEVRQHLFTERGLSMESLPPTKAALVQHAKRAVYEAGHIWGQAFKATPALPAPGDWGWTERPFWLPFTKPSFSLDSCYTVDAKKAAEVAANVTRQL